MMIYDTVINPGQGIGNSINLGKSLYDVINCLNKFNYKYTVVYDKNAYYEAPLIVQVHRMNLRLSFSNRKDQRLYLIELLDLDQGSMKSPLRLSYKKQHLNEFESISSTTSSDSSIDQEFTVNAATSSSSVNERNTFHLASVGPTFRSIYNKIFGPTYPGVLNLHAKSYILSYPGIAFKFKILSQVLLQKLKGKAEDVVVDELLNWEGLEDICCSSIAIFRGQSWEAFREKPHIEESCQVQVDIDHGKIVINEKDVIEIGKSTQQDVVSMLGPPDESFNKSDLRLLIHNHFLNQHCSGGGGDGQEKDREGGGGGAAAAAAAAAAAGEGVGSCNKFHNYYRLGIDLLYDLQKPHTRINQSQSKTVVTKVVLHNGGISEDLNFMKWNRCNWEIKSKKFGTIESSLYFHQFRASCFKEMAPVLLNRFESEFVDCDLDIIEIPRENSLSGTNTAKSKAWGQSKLYGLERCIIEVLNTNNCITTVTIY
ncbi:hypothetical protein KGF56_000472 [Candida oxycetoniae]|uniref:Uncharacterized protein n=1 Tax=Candida oxycetoniae TaxID=497107 RepID=A0AAI9WZP4_9ASCO|nr:uncharacterized protein KGF56_000472 [Candida oxycetoniae]KAI3406626.2 hypothetical protein KGF56_000472 [Candida oxycetoniae]